MANSIGFWWWAVFHGCISFQFLTQSSTGHPVDGEETSSTTAEPDEKNRIGYSLIATLYYGTEPYPFCSGVVISYAHILTSRTCVITKYPIWGESLTEQTHHIPENHPPMTVVIGAYYTLPDIESMRKRSDLTKLNIQIVGVKQVYFPNEYEVSQEYRGITRLEKPTSTAANREFYLDFTILLATGSMSLPRVASSMLYSLFNGDEFNWNRIKQNWLRARYSSLTPHDCFTPGWGGNRDMRKPAYLRLETMRVILMSDSDCKVAYCVNATQSSQFELSKGEACFKSVDKGDACITDGGAPIFCDWYGPKLLGILIKPSGCNEYLLPSIYQFMWTAFGFIDRVVHWAE